MIVRSWVTPLTCSPPEVSVLAYAEGEVGFPRQRALATGGDDPRYLLESLMPVDVPERLVHALISRWGPNPI